VESEFEAPEEKSERKYQKRVAICDFWTHIAAYRPRYEKKKGGNNTILVIGSFGRKWRRFTLVLTLSTDATFCSINSSDLFGVIYVGLQNITTNITVISANLDKEEVVVHPFKEGYARRYNSCLLYLTPESWLVLWMTMKTTPEFF
jgi:hypothetical protein